MWFWMSGLAKLGGLLLAAQVPGKEALDAFPGISRGLRTIGVGIVVTEESVTRVGVDDDLVRHAVLIQQLVKLFDGALRDGPVLIALEAEDGSLEAAQLAEDMLHAAAVETADRVHRAIRAEHQRHAAAEAEAAASKLAVAVLV